jgi:ectoine hydroxylase-related dioxygenase (phytanoyl-CoA dioxygenase family)
VSRRMTILQETVEERGFAIVADLILANEIVDLSAEFSLASLQRSRAGVRHALKLPSVAALANGSRLVGIAQDILGGEAVPFRATLFDKSAEANWLVSWHQDTALPLRQRSEKPGWGPWSVKEGVVYAHAPAEALMRVVALRIHLDDSGAENGPLRVLPGTHRAGVLTDEQIRALGHEVPAVDCLITKGGVLAMRPLVVHASSKSQSEMARRVLHIEYTNSMTIAEGLELSTA